MIPNPNGACEKVSDPREQPCWDFYIQSIQEGVENAYESAIKAGYTESSAKNITMRDWFKERLRKLKRKGMLSKAERNLDKVLDLPYEKEGEIKPEILKIVVDVSKTIAGTLGKDEGYSTRSEHTGKDGEPLKIEVSQQIADKYNVLTLSTSTDCEGQTQI